MASPFLKDPTVWPFGLGRRLKANKIQSIEHKFINRIMKDKLQWMSTITDLEVAWELYFSPGLFWKCHQWYFHHSALASKPFQMLLSYLVLKDHPHRHLHMTKCFRSAKQPQNQLNRKQVVPSTFQLWKNSTMKNREFNENAGWEEVGWLYRLGCRL